MTSFNNWPVLTRYDSSHLRRIALPLGGIGTGTISLGGRGDLRDWEIVNRPAKGFNPGYAFFALRTQTDDGKLFTRALEGAISPHDYEGMVGCAVPNHGLPRFREASFEAAYPLGQVLLNDPDCPLEVRVQAFNPLLPGDGDASSFPVVAYRVVMHNASTQNVKTSVCGSFENFIGRDGSEGDAKKNVNEWRQNAGLSGLFGRTEGVPSNAAQWGTLALGVLDNANQNVSYRTTWKQASWGNTLLNFWDDFSGDGKLEEPQPEAEHDSHPNVPLQQDAPMLSLCSEIELAPGETKTMTFLIAWHFPNRMTWTPRAASTPESTPEATASCCGEDTACESDVIGNYYTTQFSDAWDVLEKFAPRLEELERETVKFVRAFCDSDLPEVVKEAALYNASTLRSTTVFRTPDGNLFGWEGCHDKNGCCHGSCTHVWNYEQALAFLFGDLSRTMRDVEFLHATHQNGLMSFRVNLPIERAQEFIIAAADGQLGCIMKLYRDWQLCGDDEWLRKLWPHAKKSLEFCWVPGGWDGDRDGVMEGCQHNTMDVEYYGPNPQMQGWYLGALRSAEAMASHLGEDAFAAHCRELFEFGSRWMDDHLFNGEYYEQEIRVPRSREEIAPGLLVGMGSEDFQNPELQLGAGCLIDQLVGQYFAHVAGLGYLHDVAKVKTTLQSIVRHNFKKSFHEHFNQTRSYVLGDESAVLMATYPLGRRPEKPFPYYNEVMTGFEYTLAVGLLQEGETQSGLEIIEAIRARYDGLKRSPFDEAECGHHYARAMASWAAVLALTGFEYSGVTQILQLAAAREKAQWFWSSGSAWGTIEQTPREREIEVVLRVESGVLALQKLALREFGEVGFDEVKTLRAGESFETVVSQVV